MPLLLRGFCRRLWVAIAQGDGVHLECFPGVQSVGLRGQHISAAVAVTSPRLRTAGREEGRPRPSLQPRLPGWVGPSLGLCLPELGHVT